MFRYWGVFTSEIYISVGCSFWSLHLRWKSCFVQAHLNLPVQQGMEHPLRTWKSCLLLIPLCVWMLGRGSPVRLFATPWTVARQAPLSVGFSRQEYWSGLLPGASVRNPTHDKVMRRGLMGKESQDSVVPPGFSWACTPKTRIYLPYCTVLFHSSDTLWKKLTQGFSLLHLKGMFQFKPPLITL